MSPSCVSHSQLRRRLATQLCMLALTLTLQSSPVIRSVWTLPRYALRFFARFITSHNLYSYARSDHWWNSIVLTVFTPQDWTENFRMSCQTFDYLCQRFYPHPSKKHTVIQQSISVQRQVAITLWCLATPTEYHTIAHLFGVVRSTVCKIVHKTCLAMVECLKSTPPRVIYYKE